MTRLKEMGHDGEYIFPEDQLSNLIAEVATKTAVDKTATFVPGGVDQDGYVTSDKFTGGIETNATYDFYTTMAFTECYNFNAFFESYCCCESGGKTEMEQIADIICKHPPVKIMGITDKGLLAFIGYRL